MNKLYNLLKVVALLALLGCMAVACEKVGTNPLVGVWQCETYGLRFTFDNTQMNLNMMDACEESGEVAGLRFYEDGGVVAFGDNYMPGLGTKGQGMENGIMRWMEESDGPYLVLVGNAPEYSSLLMRVDVYDDVMELVYPMLSTEYDADSGKTGNITADLFIKYRKIVTNAPGSAS